MKSKHRGKIQIIKYCKQMLTDAERKAERESIAKIEAYKKQEKQVYRRIEKERAAADKKDVELNHDHFEASLESHIKQLQSELLEIEINLQEALKEATKKFSSKVTTIIEEMKLLTSEYIQNVSTEVSVFNEKFREAAIVEKDKFVVHFDEVSEDDIQKEYENNLPLFEALSYYYQDADALVQHLEGFKESTETKIAGYESTICTAI